MERNWDLKEVSDGRLYSDEDMAEVGCHECEGCSACCAGMGSSITLDPYDIYNLTVALKLSFEELLGKILELNVVDGIILPNLKMNKKEENCTFLNKEGRCVIHEFRPGICRLFPLGRVYENRDYKYFIQIYECIKTDRTKVKISEWLGVESIKRYHEFINNWHYFLKDMQEMIIKLNDTDMTRKINMGILNRFFVDKYNTEQEFYNQFDKRISEEKACYEFFCD